MSYQFGPTAKPEDVGSYVAEQFDNEALYVHLQGLPFAHLESIAQESYIREASGVIGQLSLSNNLVTSDVWRLDHATNPNGDRVPYHTDNPFYERPEKYIGFWNVRSSEKGGENVLLPLRTILENQYRAPRHAAGMITEAQLRQVTFSQKEHTVTAPIIDTDTRRIRFDSRYIGWPNDFFAQALARLLERQTFEAKSIKLNEGDVLFFDNHKLLHARQPYADSRRTTIRVRIKDEEAN